MYNFVVMEIKDLTDEMHQFVSEKGWYDPGTPRSQTPKNLALSLSIEAAEVLELFQWIEEAPDPDLLANELADVLLYLLQLASISGIDLEQAVVEKLKINKGRTWDQKLTGNEDNSD